MAKEAAGTAQVKKVEKKPSKPSKPGLFSRLIDYLKGVKLELKRVVWPNREEIINSTIIVIVTLIFFSIFTFGIDSLSSLLIISIDKLLG